MNDKLPISCFIIAQNEADRIAEDRVCELRDGEKGPGGSAEKALARREREGICAGKEYQLLEAAAELDELELERTHVLP